MKHLYFGETPTDYAVCGSTNKNLLASGRRNRTNPDLGNFEEFGRFVENNDQVCKKCLKRYNESLAKRSA